MMRRIESRVALVAGAGIGFAPAAQRIGRSTVQGANACPTRRNCASTFCTRHSPRFSERTRRVSVNAASFFSARVDYSAFSHEEYVVGAIGNSSQIESTPKSSMCASI